MHARPILTFLALLALAATAAPAAAQQPPPDRLGARGGAEIRVEQPRDVGEAAPAKTSESELDGFPLGWPLTLGLIVLAVVLLVHMPLRVRRAARPQGARLSVSA